MKKSLVTLVAVVLVMLAIPAMSADLLVGGGASVNMYGTANGVVETKPFMMLGVGVPVTINFLGGLSPDKAFLVGKYGRVKELGADSYVSTYAGSLAGVWSLTADSTKKFQPYFLMQANLDNVDPPSGGLISYFEGQVGFGASYPVFDRARLGAGFGFRMGADINSDFALAMQIAL